MIPTINQPIRVGKHSATAIDHIMVNCTVDCQFKTVILKTEYFPIAMALRADEPIRQSPKVQNVPNLTIMKKPSNHLKKDFEKLTGRDLKTARIPMKHINIFKKHLFQFMMMFSQK